MIVTVNEFTDLMRDCDTKFKSMGGSTRHYVRDILFPEMESRGFIVFKVTEEPKKIEIDSVEIKKSIAIGLRSKGYSLRQIQRALGYKSVRSIQHILK